MIKDFDTYINEDYFSKLASRKDNGIVRKEKLLTEDDVRDLIKPNSEQCVKSITIRYENGEPIVDIDGAVFLREDIEEIPFQFGTVTGCFDCSRCKNLTSLEGFPKEVGKYFDCVHCENLTSLEGCPKEVGSDFYCYGCSKQFTEEEVKSLCNVKGKIYV